MSDELFNSELNKLPTARQKEIISKETELLKKLSLSGDLLAKKYLSKFYKIPEEEIIFSKGKYSKPYVLNVNAHYNISHSRTITSIAISDKPIGICTEHIGDFPIITAHKKFNEDEKKYINDNLSNAKKQISEKAFYELFSAKKAFIKLYGDTKTDISNSLNFVSVKGKLVPDNKNIELIYDYGIPGTVTAIVTEKD